MDQNDVLKMTFFLGLKNPKKSFYGKNKKTTFASLKNIDF